MRRLCSSLYGAGPTTERKVARRLASLSAPVRSLASKNCSSLSAY